MSETNISETFTAEADGAASLPAYIFNEPETRITFPVKWPGYPDGLPVTHILRKPRLDELAAFKTKSVYLTRVDANGAMTSDADAAADACAWLWDQLITGVDGYPGLPDSLAEIKAKMRGGHKQLAIGFLYAGEVEIVESECQASFSGGEYVVQIKVGAEEPESLIKVRFREWSESERKAFEKTYLSHKTKPEAKERVTRATLSLEAYVRLFDALVLNIEVGKLHEGAWGEVPRERFLQQIDGEWKFFLMSKLTGDWKDALGKSQKG